VLDKVQKKLQEASNSIDDVAVRRRAIDRKLRSIEVLPEADATMMLGIGKGIDLDQLDGPDEVVPENVPRH
jgi:DNA recombination protein RmuC